MSLEGCEASLIRAGADAVAQWRRENPSSLIAAAHVIATDLDLSGADLSKANLSNGRFVRCNLRHVNFAHANLKATEFRDCIMEDTEFDGANLTHTKISASSLDGARFSGSRSLGRIGRLHVANRVLRPIIVDPTALPWFDRWIGWDRLRFLSTIRIFVPAYASLALTVLYLNATAWYNSAATLLNARIPPTAGPLSIPPLPIVTPSWIQVLVLINFAFLAVAATSFLGCPARVVELSRERWINELHEPEILYDHATWQRPVIRMLCATALLAGGLLSGFLLGRGIIQQTITIIRAIN